MSSSKSSKINNTAHENASTNVKEKDESEEMDDSIVQLPLNLGIKNVKQILHCIQSGSREVKDVILNECNIIYECKACLNLFRSLGNFLYHKRCFCKKHMCESMLLFQHFEEPETIVVQPEPVTETETTTQPEADVHSEKSIDSEAAAQNVVPAEIDINNKSDSILQSELVIDDKDSNQIETNQECEDTPVSVPSYELEQKSLGTISNSESQVQHIEENVDIKAQSKIVFVNSKRDVKDSNIHKSPNVKDLTGENNLSINVKHEKIIPITLRPIQGNPNAVFQIMSKRDSNSLDEPTGTKKMKTDVSNVTNAVSKDNDNKIIIVVPKSEIPKEDLSPLKIIPKTNDIHLTRRKRLLNRSDCNVQRLECLKCKTQFTTLKTLYFHMMSIHSQKRLYFPCPFCKAFFVQMYGVTRHLTAVHGKGKDQINNKLREAIRKKAIWKRVNNNDDEQFTTEKENDNIETNKKMLPENGLAKSFEKSPFRTFVKMENSISLHECAKCHRVFGRKSSQVSHQKFCIMNSVKADDSVSSHLNHSTTFVTVIPHLSEKTNATDVKVNPRPKRGAEKQMHKDFVDSQTLKWRSANKVDTNRSPTIVKEKKTVFKSHEKKILTIVNVEKLLCLKCDKKFSSYSNLRRHAAIHIGWTRFKCKHCQYQSYNKSDCRSHVQRAHSVPEDELDSLIIDLVAERSSQKSQASSVTVKSPSPSKQKENKKSSPSNKNKSVQSKSTVSRAHSPVKSKSKHSATKVTITKRSLTASKKEKSTKSVQLAKTSGYKKTQGSYKSVTTSSPTTIILSKTSSPTKVQTVKKLTSFISEHSDTTSDNEKNTNIRTSPRKSENGQKLFEKKTNTNLSTRSAAYCKSGIVQTKLPSKVICSTSVIKKEDGIIQIPERTYSKKDRPISDWFPKKTASINVGMKGLTTSTVPRRDSAPVIIGLVPASSTTTSPVRHKTLNANS